jgi:hypothetical protein
MVLHGGFATLKCWSGQRCWHGLYDMRDPPVSGPCRKIRSPSLPRAAWPQPHTGLACLQRRPRPLPPPPYAPACRASLARGPPPSSANPQLQLTPRVRSSAGGACPHPCSSSSSSQRLPPRPINSARATAYSILTRPGQSTSGCHSVLLIDVDLMDVTFELNNRNI